MIPEAFARLQEREQKQAEEAERKAKIQRSEDSAKQKELYDKFAPLLRPYHNAELSDYWKKKKIKIKVAFFPGEYKAEVYFNSHRFLTFEPKWHSYSECYSDGYPTGEGSSWLTFSVTQHQNKNGYEDYGCWFKCGIHELDKGNAEDIFAEAMSDMIREYDYANWEK